MSDERVFEYEATYNRDILCDEQICDVLKRVWIMIYEWSNKSGSFPFASLSNVSFVIKSFRKFRSLPVKNQYSVFYFILSVASFRQDIDEKGDWVVYLNKDARHGNFHLLKLWSNICNQYLERLPSNEKQEQRKKRETSLKNMTKEKLEKDLKVLRTLYMTVTKNTSAVSCPDFEKQIKPTFVLMNSYSNSNMGLKRKRTWENHRVYGRKSLPETCEDVLHSSTV